MVVVGLSVVVVVEGTVVTGETVVVVPAVVVVDTGVEGGEVSGGMVSSEDGVEGGI